MSAIHRWAVCGFAFCALTGAASAAPVDDFLSRLNAWLAGGQASIDVSVPDGKSKTIALLPTPATLVGRGGPVPLGTFVEIDTIGTEGDDILVANAVTITGFDDEEEGVRVLVDTIALQRVALPPLGTTNPYLLAQMVGGIRLSNVVIQFGPNIIQADQISMGIASQPNLLESDPQGFLLSLNLQGVVLNQSMLRSMDLDDLPGLLPILATSKVDFRVPLAWDLATGTLDISQVQLVVPGLGTYVVGVQLGGVTEPLLAELGATLAAQADGGQMDESEQQALGMRLLSQLSFNVGTVQLIDGGMVDVATSGFAAETGKGSEDFKLLLVDGLDDGLGELGVSDSFIEAAATAVAAFVDAGGTLGLDAAPATPVTLLELVALGQSPQLLVDRLGLTPVHLP